MIDPQLVVEAHRFSRFQRQRFKSKDVCGCFYCEDQFQASAIEEWCDERDEENVTALCPSCGIDSVISIADANTIGIGLADFGELLKEMKIHWF